MMTAVTKMPLSTQHLDHTGNFKLVGEPAVGICGSRNADEKAIELARRFGEIVAEQGLVLVSGNARGVDDAAQLGALEAGGRVISVLAEGLSGWLPRATYRKLITAENYVAVSEFPSDARWQTWRAMQRNGTIIELSRALVVVQAGEKGGTWAAGMECLKRGKPLLVVQRQESPETEGNARLIQRGGLPVSTTRRLKSSLEKLRRGEPLGGEQQALL